MKWYSILDGDNTTVHRRLLRRIQKIEKSSEDSEIEELKSRIDKLEAKDVELEAKDAELEAKDAELEAKDAELEAKDVKLEAKDIELEARIKALEDAKPEPGPEPKPEPVFYKDVPVMVTALSDDNGEYVPVEGALVYYNGTSYITSAAGQCIFQNVPLGLSEYLIVHRLNYRTQMKYTEITSTTEHISITLEAGSCYFLTTDKNSLQYDETCTLRASFMNHEGAPVPENLAIMNSFGHNEGTMPFDAEQYVGEAEFTGRNRGNVTLIAGKDGIWSDPVQIRDGVDSNYVQFRVQSEDKEPIAYASIHVLSTESLWDERYSGNTTVDGCLTLRIPKGIYKLIIDHGNYETYEDNYLELEHKEYVEVIMKKKS